MKEDNKQNQKGVIKKVSGPLVIANGLARAEMYEVVKVGEEGLVGEVVQIQGEDVYIQVYEETSGVGPGESVNLTGNPLTVELGPGMLSTIYDGIQRPLGKLIEKSGSFISRGIEVNALDREKKWEFKPNKQKGEKVVAGDELGEVKETGAITHKIMVPPFVEEGELTFIAEKSALTVDDVIAEIETSEGKQSVRMAHQWSIRNPRPTKEKLIPGKGLITGQRVIDTFFPIAKGGTGAVPGPFGSGKTVVQHQLAKWADADIIIFVGCGERGNEMTDLLNEFEELNDPQTGRPLMERTVLVANTSNMPVAAREASIYTGITIGEYFRDMGYSVVLLADSTSRWAEALREISGRLEEMPGDEGYPAYLGSRTAAFYERAGDFKCKGSENKEGYLTVVGAVSPPGGDLSEPVTQNTLRVTKIFWSLDASLASQRHFPAINWLSSYSLYSDNLREFLEEQGGEDFNKMRDEALEILQKESELQEIVRLVGEGALSKRDQFLLEIARIIREDFLHQNAFSDIDTYTSFRKQYLMLSKMIGLYNKGLERIEKGEEVKDILTDSIKEKLSGMKMIEENNLQKFEEIDADEGRKS